MDKKYMPHKNYIENYHNLNLCHENRLYLENGLNLNAYAHITNKTLYEHTLMYTKEVFDILHYEIIDIGIYDAYYKIKNIIRDDENGS